MLGNPPRPPPFGRWAGGLSEPAQQRAAAPSARLNRPLPGLASRMLAAAAAGCLRKGSASCVEIIYGDAVSIEAPTRRAGRSA
jgi:hypothetical protein